MPCWRRRLREALPAARAFPRCRCGSAAYRRPWRAAVPEHATRGSPACRWWPAANGRRYTISTPSAHRSRVDRLGERDQVRNSAAGAAGIISGEAARAARIPRRSMGDKRPGLESPGIHAPHARIAAHKS